MRPHRRQPTKLPRPWDSPGKNTGVGCHFLLQCMKVKSQSEVAQSCPTLSNPMDCSPPGSSVHGIFQARVLECGAIAFSITCLVCFYTMTKHIFRASQWLNGKESTHNAGDAGLIPESGRSLEKGMGIHSRILAWRIPWTEELVGYSP